MVESPSQIILEPSQREFFGRLARRMRDVGYLSISITIMSVVLTVGSFMAQLWGGRVEDAIAYLSSYLNGNRQIAWSRIFDILVDAPVTIIMGLLLVQGSRCFGAIYKGEGAVAESLVGGLLQFKRIIDAFYVRLLLLVGLVWLIVFFG